MADETPVTTAPAVTLSGPALAGYTDSRETMRTALSLPQEVRLGAVLKPARMAMAVPLEQFVTELKALPTSTNYRSKAKTSLSRMYLNDRYGCCVISGKGHKLGVASANDTDSGGEVQATDAEILATYNAWKAGRGDSGCVITDVLDNMKTQGFMAGGTRYKIDGYVAVNNKNVDLAKAALVIFGGLTLGLNLPSDWTNNDTWDVTNSRIVGGHDVEAVDYDQDFLYISSWGRIYRMTWAAFTNSRWVTECYATLEPLWYNNDQIAPSGFKVDALRKALSDIGGGVAPNVDPPTPPVPPGPPVPPVPPVPPKPATVTITVPSLPVKVFGLSIGSTAPFSGTFPVDATGAAAALNPNWSAVVQDVIALVAAIQTGRILGIIASARQLLLDLGIGQHHVASIDWNAIDWTAVAADVGILIGAVTTKQWGAAIGAVVKLLTDMGLLQGSR